MMKSTFAILVLLASLASAMAENWPSFRGPTRQGISMERDLPLTWSADSNIAWKTEIPGNGWSSPVVWGDRVFVTSTSDDDTKCRVICVDRKSGKITWNKEVFTQVPKRKENKNSYATPTPATDGQHVYVVFGDGSMAALTMDGAIVWTNRDVQFYSRHGLGASPLVYSNLVIMPFDGSNPIGAAGVYPKVSDEEKLGWQIPWDKAFIAALDTKTGKRIWTAKRGMSRIAHVSPILIDDGVKDVLVSGAGDRVQGFDPRTGAQLWSAYAQGEGVFVPGQESLGDAVTALRSTNGGVSFGQPIGVNAPELKQYLYPRIVHSGPGAFEVVYYEGLIDKPASFVRATSVDGGATWARATLGSAGTFNPSFSSLGWLGAYVGLAASGSTNFAAFSENSSGSTHISFVAAPLP